MLSFWKKYKSLILNIALPLAVGLVSGLLTMGAMEDFAALNQPPLSPPPLVFPIVWGILFSLMGIGAARVSLTPVSRERSAGLNLFVWQLTVNFFWSLIFFNLRAYGTALAWLGLLWVLIAWMIFAFRKTDKLAAWLQVPYLLWVSFAGYLNWAVWVMN